MDYKRHIEAFNDLLLDEMDTFLRDFTRWELPEDKQYLLDLCDYDDVGHYERLVAFAQNYPYFAAEEVQEEYIQAEAAELAKHLIAEASDD